MTWRQPIPSWRQRQLAQREVDREFQQNDQVANVMGLTEEPPAPVPPAPAAGNIMDEPAFSEDGPAAAIAQTEHHSVGKDFLLAGRAVFTVAGKATRFTFKIRRKEPQAGSRFGPSYYVDVLTGVKPLPDDADEDEFNSPYSYLGILNADTGAVKLTKGSKVTEADQALKALRWTLALVWAGRELPAPAAIYHEGRCGRCGKPLTVPESILSGIGPDCAKKAGVPLKVSGRRKPKKTEGAE